MCRSGEGHAHYCKEATPSPAESRHPEPVWAPVGCWSDPVVSKAFGQIAGSRALKEGSSDPSKVNEILNTGAVTS